MQAETESVSFLILLSSEVSFLRSKAVTGLISELQTKGISLFIFMISANISLPSLGGSPPFHSNVFPIISAPARVFKSEGQAGVIQYPLLNALRHREDLQVIFVEDRMDTPWKELMIPFESIDYNLSLATTKNKWVASVNKITELNLDEVKRQVLTKHGVHSISLGALKKTGRGSHASSPPGRTIVPLVSAAAGDPIPPKGHPLREVFIGTLTHAAHNLAGWKDCGILIGDGTIKKEPSCPAVLNPSNPWLWRALNMHRIVIVPFRQAEGSSLFCEKGKPQITPHTVSESMKEGDRFSPELTASPTFLCQMMKFKDFRKMAVGITLKSVGDVLRKSSPQEEGVPVFDLLRGFIADIPPSVE